MEKWCDIEGYMGKYQISNMGNVMSMNYCNSGKPRLLKLKENKRTGHYEVSLSLNDKKKEYMVARLVAQHFLKNPKNCPIVTHINNDKSDNRVENLKWVFNSESKHMMYKKGNRKIGEASEYRISFRGVQYKSYSEIARAYGMTDAQFHKRLNEGWNMDDIVDIPVAIENCGNKPLSYEYRGNYMTLAEISAQTGIPEKTIRKRLEHRWSLVEASEIPVAVNMRRGAR